MNVIILPEQQEEIKEQLKELIFKALEETKASAKVNNRYYNQTELCQYLGKGVEVVKRMKENGLPYFKTGRAQHNGSMMYMSTSIRSKLATYIIKIPSHGLKVSCDVLMIFRKGVKQ